VVPDTRGVWYGLIQQPQLACLRGNVGKPGMRLLGGVSSIAFMYRRGCREKARRDVDMGFSARRLQISHGRSLFRLAAGKEYLCDRHEYFLFLEAIEIRMV
jgi:hypothetical protein